jgi:hypothetical protein
MPFKSITTTESCIHCGKAAYFESKSGNLFCQSHQNKCPAIIRIKEEKKKIIGKDGLNSNQRKVFKILKTKSTTIGEDGLNINQRASMKTTIAKKKDIKDGLDTFQRSSLKAISTLKSQIDTETGLSKFELIKLKQRKVLNEFDSDIKYTEISTFNDTKYTKWYISIINSAKDQNRRKKKGMYYEKHHIIPKSIGGSNNKNNLILLTAKEHFICHYLLTKMVSGNNLFKILCAFAQMQSRNKYMMRQTSKSYEKNKKKLSKFRSEKLKGKGVCYISKEIRRKNSSGHDRSYMKKMIWVKNQTDMKLIHESNYEEYKKYGYVLGRLKTIHIHHPLLLISKRIIPSSLEIYLSEGYLIGRKPKIQNTD